MEDQIATRESGVKPKEAKPVDKKKVIRITATVLVIGVIFGGIYVMHTSRYIYVDKSQIEAPTIELAPSQPGTLEAIYVHEGDQVDANTIVARVGNELLKTKVAGIITSVENNIGAGFAPGTPVVDMIDPASLHVSGRLDETKGLDAVHVGQSIDFTVDAFNGKTYHGTVDEVAPSARETALSFSISDTRPTQEFIIKARFDLSLYPELKNGMSARMWIYK